MKREYSKYFKMPSLQDAAKRDKSPVHINYEKDLIDDEEKDLGKGKKYFVRTYGCQGNEADGETLSGILEAMGYSKGKDEADADVVLLNTCSVRENADDKVFGEIGALKKLKTDNKDMVIGMCGCMGQQPHIVEKLKKSYPQVDLVFGTHNINKLPTLLKEVVINHKRVIDVESNSNEIVECLPMKRESTFKAWVNIMYGCDKFCTYCIVPYTRGKERSRHMEDVLKEVQDLKDKGYKEITLIGQNVNAYGNDLGLGYDFATLLEKVSDIGIERIRFVTSHPWNFTSHMIDVIASRDNIMPYIHLPLQSGDDEILRKMGRRYTYKEYKELADMIRNKVKGCTISTDIIVGFPNESEEQFENTLKAVRECKYDSAYTFIYSPRVGTPAAKMKDNVTRKQKQDRFNRLVDEVAKYAKESNDRCLGKTLKVLVEGTSKKNEDILSGYSEENKLVNFKGDKSKIGQIVKVKITNSKTWFLEGEEVE